MRVRPVSTVLARRTDRHSIIERLADGDTTVYTQGSSASASIHSRMFHSVEGAMQERNATKSTESRMENEEIEEKYEPLRNHNSAIHPRRRIKEHPMMMYRSRLVERVSSVHEEIVGRVDFDHRRSIPSHPAIPHQHKRSISVRTSIPSASVQTHRHTKGGEGEKGGEGKGEQGTYGQVPLTPITLLGNNPSGFASST